MTNIDQRARLGPPPQNASRAEAAAYVATLGADLARIARRGGMPTLAYLLEMAVLEAQGHLAEDDVLEQDVRLS